MEGEIRKATEKALQALGIENPDFNIEWPNDISYGDYSTNAALKTFGPVIKDSIPSEKGSVWNVWRPNVKEKFWNPRKLAEELAPKIKHELGASAARVEVAGPGFINVTLSREYVTEQLRIAAGLGNELGKEMADAQKRVLIEYSCPNPFKEMHIGHLMSTIIGESVSRLVENSGATVIRDSYGGDVGPHVAKAIWALQKKGNAQPASAKEIGDAYAHGSRAYEESEEVKKEIDDLNVALYTALATEADKLTNEQRELLELWRTGREVALEAFRDIYRVLDTHFDYFLFESETTPIGLSVVRDELARGVFEESEGAIIYRGEKKGLHTLVFVTSRGTPTYEAKDVGLAFLKEERIPNDESYILTAAEQIGHFKVFLAALEDIAPLVASKTHHIPHGFLRLVSGKMSSREGNVITAEELINEVITKAQAKNEDPLIAEEVAMGALKYMILRAAPGSDIVFDPDKSLSLEGDSGPYLQYATVRAKSVIAQAEAADPSQAAGVTGSGEEIPPEPYLLERLLIRYPEVVARAQQECAPHHVVTYLTQLASEWNSFYAKERIIGGEYQAYKLEIARAFVQAMTAGLMLLAIPVPEEM